MILIVINSSVKGLLTATEVKMCNFDRSDGNSESLDCVWLKKF